MSVSADFQLITSEKDLERMIKDLEVKNVVLAGLTDDLHQFLFAVRAVRGRRVAIEAISPASRSLKALEPIQIIFGLGDGQYLVRTVIDEASVKSALSRSVKKFTDFSDETTSEPLFPLKKAWNFRF